MPALICAEEIAYNEIRQRILDGRLAPGTRLVHRLLAKELGFSSGPVVLALRSLERDGLVTNTPGLGAHVTTWSRDEIIDLYQMRAVNEGLAARMAAERGTRTDIGAIIAANEAVKRSTDASDVEANIQAEVEFHSALVHGSHCPRLERMVDALSIMQYSIRAFAMNLNVPRLLSASVRDVHDPIVQAIVERDPASAEKAARSHVEESLARNLAWIEEVSAALVNGLDSKSTWWGKKDVAVSVT